MTNKLIGLRLQKYIDYLVKLHKQDIGRPYQILCDKKIDQVESEISPTGARTRFEPGTSGL